MLISLIYYFHLVKRAKGELDTCASHDLHSFMMGGRENSGKNAKCSVKAQIEVREDMTIRKISIFLNTLFLMAALLSLVFFYDNTAFSQERHKVTVQLVLVDIVVTDRNGQVVADLTKDDFEITEDGRRMDINSLDFFDFRPTAPRPSPMTPSSQRQTPKKRLIVIFDSMNTIKRILDRSKAQIIERLLELIRHGYEVMVFELTEKGEMRILQPLTSDEQLIRQAIDKASGSIWVERAEETLAVPRFIFEDKRIPYEFFKEVTSQNYQFETRRRYEATLTALLSVMNVIKDLPGRKPVFIISGGFPYFNNIDVIQLAKINDPFQVLRKNKLVTADEIFRHLITFANSHNITFYSLYSDDFLRYVLPDMALDNIKMTNEIAEIRKSELYNLSDLATETTGVAMSGVDKFQDFQQMVQRDLSSYYEISYIPPRNKADGKYHKITVKTRRPDIVLLYRQGYFDYDEDQRESLLFASAAFNPSLFRGIPFAANMVPVAVGPNRFILWMTMALPAQGFLLGEDETQERKVIKVSLNLIDEENRLALSARVNTPIRLSSEFRRRLANTRYFGFNACSQEMEFQKDRYWAVIALYDQDSRVISTVECSLEVPRSSREAAGSIVNAVLGQVIELADARLNDFSFSQEDGTLEFLGYKFYPLSVNEFSQKEKVSLYLQVRGAQDEGNLNLTFSTSREGEGPVEVKAREIARSRNKKANVWNIVFQLNLSHLTSGDYVLQISRQGRPEEQKATLFRLPFRLL